MAMRMNRKSLWMLLMAMGMFCTSVDAARFNVLFVAVDDMRPALGCYGDPVAVTPHIDALAAGGTTFLRAYCQQSVCNASRASLMTGRRPDTTRVHDLTTHFRKALPDVVTLPQRFRQAGYRSLSVGKVYHGAKGHALGNGIDDDPSWSEDLWFPQLNFYHTDEGIRIAETWFEQHQSALTKAYPQLGTPEATWRDAVVRGLPWEAPDVADDALADGQIAAKAVAHLRECANRDEPFFLAVGFLKPHVPFVAPKRYFDLHPPKSIPPVPNPFIPQGAPGFSHLDSAEMRVYHGIPPRRGQPVADEELTQEMRRAYHSCVSFIDAQVGRLTAALTELGLEDDTIVCLWGDHGYHLGENGLWCKRNNFELACHSPLILRVPGQANPGKRTQALVEFVDVMPTLYEACDLSPDETAEGTSLLPLMKEPDRSWKKAAFSQYPRAVDKVGAVMGRSMRTDRWRFTEWRNEPGTFRMVELYDMQNDPMGNENVAKREEHAGLIKELTRQLRAGWKEARP